MSNYFPDNWVVIRFSGVDPHYRVLAGWSGGYLNGTSWKLNSGIISVTETDEAYLFSGSSGSVYTCPKSSYGLKLNNDYIWNKLVYHHGELVYLMPEETNWLELDWIIQQKHMEN